MTVIQNKLIIQDKILDIKPVKMKYMKDDFFKYFSLIKNLKLKIFEYADGRYIWNSFLKGVFDNNNKDIDVFNENINEKNMNELIEKIEYVNEIDKNFEQIENKKDKKNSKKEDIKPLTIRNGYALLGVHCGLSENMLDECSYLFYKDCIDELAIKFNWDIIIHILSRTVFDEESHQSVLEVAQESNPINLKISPKKKKQIAEGNTIEGLKKMGVDIKVMKPNNFISVKEMFDKQVEKNENKDNK